MSTAMARRPPRAVSREDHESASVEIRSYHRVFALERRLYRIDGLPLNPAGVPLRGVAYFALLFVVALIGRELPVVEYALALIPWYMRDLLAPAFGAFVLSVVRVDGRPFHIAALALLEYRLGSRRLVGLRVVDDPDGCWRARERNRAVWLIFTRAIACRLEGRTLTVFTARRSPVHAGRRPSRICGARQ